MKKICSIALAIFVLNANAQKAKTTSKITTIKQPIKVTAAKGPFKNQKDSVSYAVGVNIGKSLKEQNLNTLDNNLLLAGMNDQFAGKKLMIAEMAGLQLIQSYVAAAKTAEITNAKPTSKDGVIKLVTQRDSASYAIGCNIATSLKMQKLNDVNTKIVGKAIEDLCAGKKPLLDETVGGMCINNYTHKKDFAKANKLKSIGKKYMKKNAKKKGVKTMPEGWQYEVLKTSDSKEFPNLTDKVKCHYHGTLTDGTVFDSSVDRGEPASFPVNGVIKGWQLALPMMNVGSKWKVTIPSDLAYGDRGAGEKIGPGATLIFEIELLAIEK